MGNVSKALLLSGAVLTAAGCHSQQQNDQNIVITNEIPANAEIEALPPDESSTTPSDQLANGDDNARVSDLNASTNAN